MKHHIIAAAAMLCATAAHADLVVTFDEGAPKDRFTFQNTAACDLPAATLTLDLNASAGALVFDTTDQGAGVEVFQPFELVAGKNQVTGTSAVTDGDKRLTIDIKGLNAGEKLAFTIDVDDTLGGREITVNDTEISGAMVSADHAGSVSSAAFKGSSALIPLPCSS